MNYVFFGTPEFAAIVLEKLIAAGFVPAAVVCNPDRPVGRKKVITAPAVKSRITYHVSRIKENIEILQPEKLDSGFKLQVSGYKPDLFIVASYAKIIPTDILGIPRLGAIGVHPSLLPKYRGASPIQSAILNGEEESGVTLYLMDEKVDHGPVIANAKCKNQNEQWGYAELQKILAELGGGLLVETLPKFLAGEITPREQNHSEATFTKKFTTEDGFVPKDELVRALAGDARLSRTIYRSILALHPEPGVWTYGKNQNGKIKMENGKRIKILKAHLERTVLVLDEIQVEGKNPMLAKDLNFLQ